MPSTDKTAAATIASTLAATSTRDTEPLALRITVTRSAGSDSAVLVMIDTTFEPNGDHGSPGLRVLVNDADVNTNPREYVQFGETGNGERAATHVELCVPVAAVSYLAPL